MGKHAALHNDFSTMLPTGTADFRWSVFVTIIHAQTPFPHNPGQNYVGLSCTMPCLDRQSGSGIDRLISQKLERLPESRCHNRSLSILHRAASIRTCYENCQFLKIGDKDFNRILKVGTSAIRRWPESTWGINCLESRGSHNTSHNNNNLILSITHSPENAQMRFT